MALSRFLLGECAGLGSGRNCDTRKRFQAARAFCLQLRTAMRAMLSGFWRTGLTAIFGAALLALVSLSAEAHSGPHGQAHTSLREQARNAALGSAADNKHTSDAASASNAAAPFQCPGGTGEACCCNSACAVGTPTPAIADAHASSLLIQPPISLLSQSPTADRVTFSAWLLVSSPPRAPPLY